MSWRENFRQMKRCILFALTLITTIASLFGSAHARLNCYDCHGSRDQMDYRPKDALYRNMTTGGFRGNHQTHLDSSARAVDCAACHPGSTAYTSSHRDGYIQLAKNINNSPAGAKYGEYTSRKPQSSTPLLTNCTNVNCHFESNTMQWGANPLQNNQCDVCHLAPPSDGSHGGKHGQYLGTGTDSCARCHIDHTQEAKPLFHATEVGKRPLAIQFSGSNSLGRYSGNVRYPDFLPSKQPSRHGACLNLFCHSDGRGGAPVVVPIWGTSLPGDCTGCHGGNYSSFRQITSGSHGLHVSSRYTCGKCHANTVNDGDDRTITLRANHLDGNKTIALSGSGNYSSSTKTCSSTSCHGTSNIVWGSSGTSDCSGCHGGDASSGRSISSGKHGAHMKNYTTLGRGNNIGCAGCHAKTVSANRTIIPTGNHNNTYLDYSGAMAGRIDSIGSGKCSNNYCHSTGAKNNQFWNMSAANWYSNRNMGCNGCHGALVYPDGTFAAFTSAAGEPSYANGGALSPTANSHQKHARGSGMFDSTGCSGCHYSTVDTYAANKLKDNSTTHLNKIQDISFSPNVSLGGVQGRFSAATQQCINTYCHGANPSAHWGSPSLECTTCHSAEVGGFTAQSAGAHNIHYQSAVPPTSGSYGTMPAANIGSASQYQFTCTTCHAPPSKHGNGKANPVTGAAAQVYFGYTTPGMRGAYRFAATSEATADNWFKWTGGKCMLVYCHSNGAGGFVNITSVNWNTPVGALGNDCTGCHGGNASSRAPMATNAHASHINNTGVIGVNLLCNDCHAKTVGDDLTIADKRVHVNKFKDYSGIRAGESANYNNTSKQCVNSYCHSNGKIGTSAQAYVNPPAWNSGSTLGCNGCHGTSNSQGAPDYTSGGIGSATANNHLKHSVTNEVSTNINCSACHLLTTSNGTAIKSDQTPSKHINGNSSDVFFNMSGGPYTSSTKTCSQVYCHSSGAPFDKANSYKPETWGGGGLNCYTCHDGATQTTTMSGLHDRHINPSSYAFTCERCHSNTVIGNSTIKDKSYHVNKVKDVNFKEGGVYEVSNKGCDSTYCHSDALGRPSMIPVRWTDAANPVECFDCHRGRAEDNTPANCARIGGTWNAGQGICSSYLNMSSNGHGRLVGPQWIRLYPCYYCHNATVDSNGTIIDKTKHVNGIKEVSMAPRWAIVGRPAPSYNPTTKICDNVYCHSDGTSNPDTVKPFAWTEKKTECNTCHGHPRGSCSITNCHDGRLDSYGKLWTLPSIYGNRTSYSWPNGQDWKAAVPMFPNQGAGTARANSHSRHTETNFTCDNCHAATIVNGTCTDCHVNGIPIGKMSEVAHLNAAYHANKAKDVLFSAGGSYNPVSKTCSSTACHTGGNDPQWGGSVNSLIVCISCHGSSSVDVDTFISTNGIKAKINMTEWTTTGHGRQTATGPYPVSGNPAANFPEGNPCWYCHDNSVIHRDTANPFRLRQHSQFNNRFDKECKYCHMVGLDSECMSCHNSAESLATQLSNLPADATTTWPDGTPAPRPDHTTMTNGQTSCITAPCHYVNPATPKADLKRHNAGAGVWTNDQQADVKNQYMMMGVCLKCHDDDTGGKCTSCHTAPPENPNKYSLGFNPGTGFIKPQSAKASSVHFGYKHNREYLDSGVWKGGKFCWDCHDPHGDNNIYMVQSKVATSTDGKFGVPYTRAEVSFTRKQSGLDYAKVAAPYNGICNVCHSTDSKHFRSDGGDGHNSSRICTSCHEHRFTDSHADNQSCTSCHKNRPVPRHSGFGQPRECTKCHAGVLNNRVDVMSQFGGTSHHIQGPNVTSKHCYACHWESTPQGLIDIRYHQGFNYLNNSSVKNAPSDLVIWGPGVRPTTYKLYSTAMVFDSTKLSFGIISSERKEVAKITPHCLSCHSDQNNNIQPFDDCKTPRRYAWDKQSIAARYSDTGTVAWGKYPSNGKSNVSKAFSAHGNATANQGGYDSVNGIDSSIPNTRNGAYNVTCFDCHNSHGSRVVGVTSSYETFNGSNNGGNLKETQAGKGGYTMTYMASGNSTPGAVNPYNAGAGQCFDCHMTAAPGTTPWGYQTTFGATASIKGYLDSIRFGQSTPGYMARYPYKTMDIVGGHLKPQSFLNHSTSAQNRINGLCTPCHDPHGVTPVLGSSKPYGVPLLKGTWLTSPYKEDAADPDTSSGQGHTPRPNVYIQGVTENEAQFAGLCLGCHQKSNLTNGTNHTWKSQDRVHESVKGWKTANGTQAHQYSCSKCHTSHNSGMKRLMVTNCLDYNHRGQTASGGQAGAGSGSGDYGSGSGSFPQGPGLSGVNCHPTGSWPDNRWNNVTPW